MKQHEQNRPPAAGKSGSGERDIIRAQDAEFSLEQADGDDLAALARADAAERRVMRGTGRPR